MMIAASPRSVPSFRESGFDSGEEQRLQPVAAEATPAVARRYSFCVITANHTPQTGQGQDTIHRSALTERLLCHCHLSFV